MSVDLVAVLLLLGAAIVMFALNRPRMDAVALIMLTALPLAHVLTGGKPVVTMGEALAGFSDPNIVLIAALFVIGDGLVRTGVARRLGDWLIAKARSSEARLLALLMVVVCGLGATMSSTAGYRHLHSGGAAHRPEHWHSAGPPHDAAQHGCPDQRHDNADRDRPEPGRQQRARAPLISGMTTLIATAPNLVVSSELERQGSPGFGFFAFTPFGVPILVLAILYMLLARRWLASANEAAAETNRRPSLADWVEDYRLAGREYRAGVTSESPLVGKTIEEMRLRDTSGASIVAIERDGKLIQPTAKTTFQAGDILLVDLFAPGINVEAIVRQYDLELMPLSGAYFTDRSQEIGMAEVIVPADSDLVGKTVVEARFRDRTGLTVIGLRRGGIAHERGLQNETLKLGDTLLLIGRWKAIARLSLDNSGVLILRLPAEIDEVLPVPGKMLQAVFCLGFVILLMVSGLVPNVQAALIGCLLMGLFGCIDLTSAYRSIDWKTLVLIVGMLPFSTALQRTGGVELAADALRAMTSGAGPRVVLATLFAITALLGMFISNTATAVLMAPVALAVAKESGASPYPFAMIVALAASTAFMTPVSSPVNTLVVTPGNYSFGDFVKIGVPFALIALVVCVILVPWLLPL